MSQVKIQRLVKKFSDTTAVSDLNVTIKDGEFVSFLGPSGCGKTTTLRMVAGFEKQTSGTISIGNTVVNADNVFVPPNQRKIGMVFQSYAVWPHMNVFDNVAYPLKIKKTDKATIREKVMNSLEVVDLGGLEKRYPNQLSGGQQQRVALARALVSEPDLLLLDEPLSNLDAKLRESMRFEIKDLQKRLGITVIYVTHDQAEAMAMSDRIVVMKKGVVQQIARPRDIYDKPANAFVADFIGLINFIEGEVVKKGEELSRVKVEGLAESIICNSRGLNGSKTLVCIRPENISIDKSSSITGKVVRKVYLGDSIDYRVKIGNDIQLRIVAPSSQDYNEGDNIGLTFETAFGFPVSK